MEYLYLLRRDGAVFRAIAMADKGLFQSFHVADVPVQLMQSVRWGACRAILTGEIYFLHLY